MKNKELKYNVFLVNANILMEVIELAKKNGKVYGDSMQEEFDIVLKKHPEEFEFLGATKDDVDMITGNLREKGLKIKNLKEVDRKKKKQ